MSTDIVGIYSGVGRVNFGNIVLPLLLSVQDRNMLESKYGDPSEWIELKIPVRDVIESKKGAERCWLMKRATYESALRSAKYANKDIKPVNVFSPGKSLIDAFFKK